MEGTEAGLRDQLSKVQAQYSRLAFQTITSNVFFKQRSGFGGGKEKRREEGKRRKGGVGGMERK